MQRLPQAEHHFSWMRSEGFPFIVGVWGWTCVRGVLVVSSSCRRRCVVNFCPLGGTHALRHNPFLQSIKSGGSLARNARLALPSHKMGGRFRVLRDRRNTLETRQCKCVVFSWQAQHLVSVLESGGSFAKVILVELYKNGFMEFEGSLARNARFGASDFQGERSFSHRGRRKILEASCLKN